MEALILAALQLAPAAMQAYAQMRSSMSATDQATLDANIAQIKEAALAAEAQAVADLEAAAKAP
jgi:hypothetical protein